MVNKYGKKESLTELYANGVASYRFDSTILSSGDVYCFENVYNEDGTKKTYRNSNGVSIGFDKPKQKTNETPTHYDNGLDYDLIDVINDYNVNFCRGNVIKYVVRAGKKKDELQDLLKAKDYLEREIERIRINNNN